MQIFEFLMVLVSIIVGLGIATLLTGLANLLRDRKTVRFYWIHSSLIAGIFLAQCQVWWERWDLQAAPEWTFIGLASTRNRLTHAVLAPALLLIIFLDIVLVTGVQD